MKAPGNRLTFEIRCANAVIEQDTREFLDGIGFFGGSAARSFKTEVQKTGTMQIEEFTERVLPLKDRLFRFAGCFLKEREDARDVVQDVLMKLWEKRDHLGRIENTEAFLMRMIRNRCLDKVKGSRLVPMNREAEARMEARASEEERLWERRDTVTLVRKLITRLPEQQRTVIHLRDVEQMEFEEIALISGMQVNAVRVCLSRARKQVREELLEIWKNEERRGKNSVGKVF